MGKLILAVLSLYCFYWLEQQTEGPRFYWPVSVTALASGRVKHTHVEVKGTVALVRQEADGDWHVRLTDTTFDSVFIVAECIPKLPCSPPVLGSIVTVRGISRFDGEHRWWEVHPVEELR